jgi:hypothetical protein
MQILVRVFPSRIYKLISHHLEGENNMAGIWDKMGVTTGGSYGGISGWDQTTSSQPPDQFYEKQTDKMSVRTSQLISSALRPIMEMMASGGNVTKSNLTQSGTTTQQQAGQQTGQETASSLQNTLSQLMSTMQGYEQGAQTGGSQQQQITDMINRVIGDKSDPRFASALERMAEARKNVMQQFQGAETPIAAKLDLYGEGGAYGKGAASRVRQATREAMASGRTDLTRSGMHSGSTMQGMKSRFASEEMMALQAIEDQRLQMLGGAQSELAGLRAGGAQTLAQMRDPAYSGFVGPTGTQTIGTQAATGATQAQQQAISGQQTAQTSEQMVNELLTKLMSGAQASASSGTTSGSTQQTVSAPVNVAQLLAAVM